MCRHDLIRRNSHTDPVCCSFHSGSVKRSVTAKVPRPHAWRIVGDITSLPKWVVGVKGCRLAGRARRRIGAIRVLDFDDGNTIEEHVIAWNDGEWFSYVAVSGLPLRAYVATISLRDVSREATRITWQSYMNSESMRQEKFASIVESMEALYADSLANLKAMLEDKMPARGRRVGSPR